MSTLKNAQRGVIINLFLSNLAYAANANQIDAPIKRYTLSKTPECANNYITKQSSTENFH